MWYRVALAKDGAVRECQPVEGVLQSGLTVFYVDEENAEAACVEAKRMYAIYYSQELRRARRKAGTCLTCSSESDTTFCEACRDDMKARRKELLAVKAALGLGPNDKLPAEYRKRPSHDHPTGFGRVVRMHRYQALQDAKKVISQKKTVAEAVRFLNNEIAKIEPTPGRHVVPKLRVVGAKAS